MRKDMFKVIVERPRPGSRYMSTIFNAYRKAKSFKLDENFDCVDEFSGLSKLPMKGKRLGWERKNFNENLNPLRRFLEKSVGRCWDDVFSEICETLDTNSTIKQHVRQHIPDFIEDRVRIDEDGTVYGLNTRRWHTASPLYKGAIYVHPETRILCEVKEDYISTSKARAAAQKIEENNRIRYFDKDGNHYVPKRSWKSSGEKDDGVKFEKIDNTWFKFIWKIIERYETKLETKDGVTVLVKHSKLFRERVKRTATKKEIRNYGLDKPVI